jgi:biopolymer transport protein TolQ
MGRSLLQIRAVPNRSRGGHPGLSAPLVPERKKTVHLLLAQMDAGFEMGVKELILASGPVAKLVLLLLFLFSMITWAIIGAKWLIFSRARRDTMRFLRLFRQHGSLGKIVARVGALRGTPLLPMLREAYQELQNLSALGAERDELLGARRPADLGTARMAPLRPEQLKFIGTVLERSATDEITRMELTLPFLATCGSTAPFIGLFGTVWGVMRAFQGIGQTASTSIATVAPGISEALVATAAGLVAAIPAVMAYNHFVHKVRQFQKVTGSFAAELLDYLEKRYCAS